MKKQIRSILDKIKSQLSILAFLIIINLLAYFEYLPDTDELTEILTAIFDKYGMPLIVLVSFLENIVGLNVYFPGSIVILTSMSLTAGDPKKAMLVFIAIVLPSTLAQNINYLIGCFSTKDLKKQNLTKLSKIKLGILFGSTFWHPHTTAITCMASGSEGLSYVVFLKYFIVFSLFWNAFWGIIMYRLGYFARAASNLSPFFYSYLVLWIIWDIVKILKDKESGGIP